MKPFENKNLYLSPGIRGLRRIELSLDCSGYYFSTCLYDGLVRSCNYSLDDLLVN